MPVPAWHEESIAKHHDSAQALIVAIPRFNDFLHRHGSPEP